MLPNVANRTAYCAPKTMNSGTGEAFVDVCFPNNSSKAELGGYAFFF